MRDRVGVVHSRASRNTGMLLGSLLGVLAALAPEGLLPEAAAQQLNGEIQQLLNRSRLGASKVGVSLVDVGSGEVLGAIRAGDPLTPASNMKLLTSGAALWTLGSDFVFRTEIRRSGDRLIVVGSGDPALADPEILDNLTPRMTVDDVVDVLAGAVVKAGIKDVHEIIIDDRVFDRQFVHPSWPTDQLNRWYCAEVSGLNFHTNVLAVFPRPSRDGPGSAPLLRIEPDAPFIEIENRGRTVKGDRNTAAISRVNDSNRFLFSGEIAVPTQVPVEVTVHNSSTLFGQLLADRLRKLGVAVPGSDGIRLAEPDEALADDPATAPAIAVVTTPIDEVLRRCNVDSHNLYAEAMMKTIGHRMTGTPGSWANGASVLRMLLSERLGPQYAASTSIADGSGMSRLNAVAPETFARWMRSIARDQKIADTFINSLARPGEGTLRSRFEGGSRLRNEIRAKSGYINSVRTLSGYVTCAETGERIAFSVMVNDIPPDAHTNVKRFHEDVVRIADAYLSKRAAERQPVPGG